MSPDTALFARPFDELQIGERFATAARTVTDMEVMAFAALTGDHHPQHIDEVWAASSPFGERIAHGMLVLSYAVGLVPLDPERIVALRRVSDAVFKRPVRLDDAIRVEGRIERADAIDDGVGLVACAWNVVNQNDRTVARLGVEVLWRRAAVLAEVAA